MGFREVQVLVDERSLELVRVLNLAASGDLVGLVRTIKNGDVLVEENVHGGCTTLTFSSLFIDPCLLAGFIDLSLLFGGDIRISGTGEGGIGGRGPGAICSTARRTYPALVDTIRDKPCTAL
jgi:hypothetical protein